MLYVRALSNITTILNKYERIWGFLVSASSYSLYKEAKNVYDIRPQLQPYIKFGMSKPVRVWVQEWGRLSLTLG